MILKFKYKEAVTLVKGSKLEAIEVRQVTGRGEKYYHIDFIFNFKTEHSTVSFDNLEKAEEVAQALFIEILQETGNSILEINEAVEVLKKK